MKITDFIKNNIVILDGGMGTMLQDRGLAAGEKPELWNISYPEDIIDIHKAYLDAGSNVISTNTFGANILKFDREYLEKIISAAVENAKIAISQCNDNKQRYVALDIGPTGRMLKPLGDLHFEEAVAIFATTIEIGVACGVDLIFIETMSDSYETKAALLAAKEYSDLPVFVSNAYGEDGKLLTGADAVAMIAMLEGMGADAIGVNCSLGPDSLEAVIDKYLEYSSLPVILKPNAGLPRVENGETVYDLTEEQFASSVLKMANKGVRAVGGCCGTTPKHISLLRQGSKKIKPLPIVKKEHSLVSSYTHAVEIADKTLLIGERINPTGKPKFREAVKSGNMEHILREAVGQQEAGAHVLDVNLGIPGIDEAAMLTDAVCRIQEVCDLPLQIDSADPVAMESALRYYNGKALINSVNGKKESLDKILPLAKKYGGVIIALTLDEDGIPALAEDRVRIARKILAEAEKYGIDKKNIIFDPLAMSVSADKDAATQTLRAVKMISEELSSRTSLGISNVSFGLPSRDLLNASFLTMCMSCGLSAAIVNPYSEAVMNAYHSYVALSGQDTSFEKYISCVAESKTASDPKAADLNDAILHGMRDLAATLASDALKNRSAMDIINGDIIPALNSVGEGYEQKRIFLPGLLMSAEAAGAAFEVIKSSASNVSADRECKIVMATVKGDIHDIGKNIVKLILENYGFDVIDLGKDVPAERIRDAVIAQNAQILGLSALMTTTLPAMERTVKMVKEACPSCMIMVGGAVLTEEYAMSIGADFYGKDAMEAVRFAEKIKNK